MSDLTVTHRAWTASCRPVLSTTSAPVAAGQVATCPSIAGYVTRHPEYAELLVG
jgi:hypothetical protein